MKELYDEKIIKEVLENPTEEEAELIEAGFSAEPGSDALERMRRAAFEKADLNIGKAKKKRFSVHKALKRTAVAAACAALVMGTGIVADAATGGAISENIRIFINGEEVDPNDSPIKIETQQLEDGEEIIVDASDLDLENGVTEIQIEDDENDVHQSISILTGDDEYFGFDEYAPTADEEDGVDFFYPYGVNTTDDEKIDITDELKENGSYHIEFTNEETGIAYDVTVTIDENGALRTDVESAYSCTEVYIGSDEDTTVETQDAD